MSALWYCQLMGETIGPLTAAELRTKARAREIVEESLVRKGRDGKWVPAWCVEGLFDDGRRGLGETASPGDKGSAGDLERLAGEVLGVADESLGDTRRTPPTTNLRDCPDCGQLVSEHAHTCIHCGRPLAKRRPSTHPPNSPGLAAVFSFLYAGLGQIYNGQFHKALLFMLGYGLCIWLAVASGFLGVIHQKFGFSAVAGLAIGIGMTIVAFFLWVWAIVDAYNSAESINRRRRP